jgi:hypothetical protein
MPVERVFDGDAELVLDDRLSPILIATWFGSPSATTIDAFHAWVDDRIAEARAQGEHLVLINDSIDSGRLDAAARRKFAEHEFDTNVLIAVPTVITSSLIRGAVTAMGWMLGEKMKSVTTWKTLPDAFDHARTALREVDARPPAPSRINSYVRPQREPASSSRSG